MTSGKLIGFGVLGFLAYYIFVHKQSAQYLEKQGEPQEKAKEQLFIRSLFDTAGLEGKQFTFQQVMALAEPRGISENRVKNLLMDTAGAHHPDGKISIVDPTTWTVQVWSFR